MSLQKLLNSAAAKLFSSAAAKLHSSAAAKLHSSAAAELATHRHSPVHETNNYKNNTNWQLPNVIQKRQLIISIEEI